MNQKIKVIINTSTYKEGPEDKVTDVINNLISSMSKYNKNFEFYVLKPMSARGNKQIDTDNVKSKAYRYSWPNSTQVFHDNGIVPSLQKNKLNVFKLIFLFISQFINLFYISLKIKPEYIYAHWFLPQAIISALICKLLNIKLVFTTHGADVLLLNNFKFLNKLLLNFVLKNTYKFTANSELTFSQIINNSKAKHTREKGKIIPMGIQDKFFETNNFNVNTKNHFLYIGRLIDYKGVELMIDCLKKFKESGNSFKLDILGSGVDELYLKKKVKKLKLEEDIIFHGFKNFDEKIKYYQSASLTFIPSLLSNKRLEGGPLTLIEAMSQKSLCIVSDSIGFIKYLNINNSIIFKSGSLDSFYKQLIKFTEITDKEKESMREAAYNDSKYFKFENIGKIHSDFLFE